MLPVSLICVGCTVTRDQFGCKSREPLGLSLRPAVFDRDIAALDVAVFAQSLQECVGDPDTRVGRTGPEIADHGHRILLRVRGKREGRSGADQTNESAPLHLALVKVGTQA